MSLTSGRTLSALWIAGCLCTAVAGVSADEPVDFSRDVLPILSNSCFACHGPDDGARKAGLRFDIRRIATASLESGVTPIVPGKPDASELVRRITHADAAERMPPADSGKKLTTQQVQTLTRWIAEGAEYEQHWAFVAPVRPVTPTVRDAAWVRNPIDAFVLAKLESEGLQPAPEADGVTLLRRLSLDLIGLPPTVEEVDAFLSDTSGGWQKQVERLLASPHYGERWGRLWLDAARYADSDGYEKDKPRTVWFYRDWVIHAFNRDLPYDQFVLEQLAGDLLPGATQDQIVATGFLRNSMLNEEGGIDPEQFRMDGMFDRMDAVGKSVLGLTIQCAQCHNHKYDPLTQEEYYRLFAYLNSDDEAMPVVYTPPQQMRIAELRRQMRELEAELKQQAPDWRERMAQWERAVAAQSQSQPQWEVLALENIGDNAQRYQLQPDGSLLAAGWSPTKFTSKFAATPKLRKITAVRLEAFTDANLPAGGPGRSYQGTFGLSEMNVQLAAGDAKPVALKFAGATADFEQPVAPIDERFADNSKNKRTTGPPALAIDDDNNTAWSIDAGPGRRNTDRVAVFQLESPVELKVDAALNIDLVQVHGGSNANDFVTNNLGRFRISVTDAENVVADEVPKKVRDFLAIPAERRTAAQTAQVFRYWRTTVPEFSEINEQIDALWRQWPEGVTTYALKQRGTPRTTTILSRGDWLKPTDPVSPGVPAFLHPLPADAELNRLTFARWLVDRKSPTTARVFVNRVWQAYFGEGLVATPEDFGLQGERPSHPELLDWLACEFMDSGWSVKHLHRLIVNSATYRQSSRVTPEAYARDPYNRLLGRGARFRVDAEIVRDVTLAASGLLNRQIGGPSIMTPAPAFLFQPPASYGEFPWHDATGDAKYRRAIYTFRRRSTPFPALVAFDAPTGDFSCVRRGRSNTPIQALTLLNEPLFVEAAQALAAKTLAEGGETDAQRLEFAFRNCTARAPEVEEARELLELLEKTRLSFSGREDEARQLAGEAAAQHPELSIADMAAWTAVCRVILNLDETISRE